jgi:hypothetical protein
MDDGVSLGNGSPGAQTQTSPAQSLTAVHTLIPPPPPPIKQAVLGTPVSSTGFVTFKTLLISTVASQAKLVTAPRAFEASPAPEPRDIVWANVAMPAMTVESRHVLVSVQLLIGAVFWGAIVSAIYSVEDILQAVQDTQWFHNLDEWPQFLLVLLFENVPTLLLVIVMSLLPWAFELLCYYYERLKTHSDVQASIARRYFSYQMVRHPTNLPYDVHRADTGKGASYPSWAQTIRKVLRHKGEVLRAEHWHAHYPTTHALPPRNRSTPT